MVREETRVYVGNLPSDCREKDIEDVFAKYGKIRFVDIKGGRGPMFAFVEFEDARDAEDAVRSRDGYDLDGSRLRVEFTRGTGPRGPGLPATGSWQDLKDHMRDAGEVCYANVSRDGTGVVEFTRFDDMKEALRKLDDTKFRSHEGETGYIRVREDTSGGGADGRGRGRGQSGSRSRSPRHSSPKNSPRSQSRSRSASRSPSRSRSRSRD
ncbi:hypothetical protein DICVIV_10680 [Dictyocaulus viviparus]|uniref:RRM domain-containing protein n=1 Tax=Dictyocaulus viviparus TaxID=29172 RepID=A0A0D8XF99_DICVI|nr:hypothetical protein DICVIV_10680 [Dictyocaulus viviparus]